MSLVSDSQPTFELNFYSSLSQEEAPTKADFLTLFQTLVLTRPPRDPVNPAPPPVQKGPSRSNFPLRRSQKNTRVAVCLFFLDLCQLSDIMRRVMYGNTPLD